MDESDRKAPADPTIDEAPLEIQLPPSEVRESHMTGRLRKYLFMVNIICLAKLTHSLLQKRCVLVFILVVCF